PPTHRPHSLAPDSPPCYNAVMHANDEASLLPRAFYARETLALSRDLLGRRLVRCLDGERVAGIIVETEAYCGAEDEACHAFRGRTARTEVMFGSPGHAYVYFIYGRYYCFNIVAESEGVAGAVLVRAVRPTEGLATMRRARPDRPDLELTNGPAKLCLAMDVGRSCNAWDLCRGEALWLEAGEPVPDERVRVGPRIGLNVGEFARTRPWRFAIAADPWVSRPAPVGRAAAEALP
ncbi:MAG: DNA-3-methyladenine glycosylase, partial [Anaerolineae bacterium]